MASLPEAPPLTPISSMLAGIDPDEFDDPEFSDDGSSFLSSAPNTLMTPVFGNGSSSPDSSASDTTATPGSMIFKRKRIKRKSYVFESANDEPEHVFSSAKLLISDLRNRLGDDIIQASECLKSWIQHGLVFGETESDMVRMEQMLQDLASRSG
ncbi:hypothetical protein BDD12DRAFT_894582 [Trichophaea hybrida]|nr:hypothetical protein BDD12DRAFT_894582 [Trichophaea hybrida]